MPEPASPSSPTLAAHEELFRLLVANVVDYAIFMLDPQGRVATWNAGAERTKGYRADEIIGKHFSTFYPPEDAGTGKAERELEVAEREGRFEEEGWRVRKDGTRFWANVVLTAVRDDSGHLVGFAKVTRDLTARKAAEEQRLATEQRFRIFIESVQDYALLILDPTGRITTWNAGAQRIKGWTAAEIIGRHFSVFYPEEDVRAGKCEWELEIAAREGRFEDENWRVRKDRTQFWANVVITAMRDASGTLVGFAKVTRDLTERKHNEEERAARLAAEQANRAKDEFLAILGHELRNPLAPISTALELIRLRGGGPTRELEVIERQAKHMMRLVDDLLDVSRIARGKVDLRKHILDLRDVVAKALEIASPLIEQRQHYLSVDLGERPLLVCGDDERLAQVLSNLVRNAAKYTDPGGRIVVRGAQHGDEIVVVVEDTGVGIAPDLLPRVFDLFVQGRQPNDRAGGGLGLGLALVRSLVTLHGGRVTVESAGEGQGSKFTVYLPAESRRAARQTGEHVQPFAVAARPRRILIVDDNEDARALLGEVLTSVGHEVRTAADGPSALELLPAFAPEIALLDIGLPVMDGYELAGQLRQRLHEQTPWLISLTGYGQPSDVEHSRQAGFNHHMVKPVDVRRLLAMLDGLD